MFATKKTFTILIEIMDESARREAQRRRMIAGIAQDGASAHLSVHDSRCSRLNETFGEVETRGGFVDPRTAFGMANMMAMQGLGPKKRMRSRAVICRRCLPGV